MKPTKNYGLSDSLIDAVRKSVEEALVGGQKKLDVDKDGKLEKSDFASLRAKKDVVTIKPKLKEDHPDEKEDKALIKKLIKKADVSDDEEDKALIKKTMKKEEEQMDEADLQEGEVKDAIDSHRRTRMDQMSRHSTHDRERAHERHQAKLDSIHNNSLRWQDSKTDADIHGDKERMERMASDTQRRKDDDEDTRKTFNVMRDRIKNHKSKNEEVEQMDEAPLRTVNALVGYPKLNKKVAAKGTPGSEDERNKAAAGLKRDRSGLGRRAYTGDQHYDVRREDVDHIDEKMSIVRGDTPRQQGNSAPHNQTIIHRTPDGGRIFTGTYFTGTKKPSAAALAVQASARERLKKMREDVEQMDEVKLADLPRRKVVGKSYGADYVDPEGADETAADMKKAEPKRKSGPQGTMKRRFIKDKSKLRMQYK